MKRKNAQKQKFLLLICAALFLFAAALSVSSVFAQDASEVVFGEIALESEYAKGSVLSVPKVTASSGGRQYVTTAILQQPDGASRIVSGECTLDIIGNYSLEYRAVVNDKAYSVKKTFACYADLFELSDAALSVYAATSADLADTIANFTDMSAEYASSGIFGNFAQLNQGETLYVNGYFDVSRFSLAEPLLNIAIVPSQKGTYDFRTLNVKFISKTDESKYLTFVCHFNDENNCTYFLAGADSQTPSGYEAYLDKIHVGDQWGAATSGSYKGVPSGTRTLQQDTLQLWLSYSDKMAYANSQKYFVIDLDDSKYFNNLWQGFDDPYVRVEITAEDYTGSAPVQLVVQSVGDIDLSRQIVRDTDAPVITVDFGAYEETSLPQAVKGKPYPLFPASAYDWFSGDCAVTVNVYGRYAGTQRYELNAESGAFTPEEEGEFTVVYTARDFSGNVAVKRVEIVAVAQTDPVSVALSQKIDAAKTGQALTVADAVASGGTGEKTMQKYVLFNGQETAVTDTFRPERSGVYTVKYVASDYIGQTGEFSYTFEAEVNDKPVFIDEITLPAYFIEGSSYVLPEVFAYDYSGDNGAQKTATSVIVNDAGGMRELDGRVYVPAADSHLETVSVRYKAVSDAGVGYSRTFDIPVCKVGNGKNIVIANYFVPESATDVSATAEYVALETETDGAVVRFATPQMASGFSLEFDVDPEKNYFESFHVYLTEVADPQNVMKVSFIKNSAISRMSVNDGAQYNISSSFYGTGASGFYFSYDNMLKKVSNGSDVTLNVEKALSGGTFRGFPSDLVYVSFVFNGVYGASAVQVKRLGGQNINNTTFDLIKPKISLLGDPELRYTQNETVKLYPAVAVDALDPNITSYFSVYDPDGEIMTDVDGRRLERLDISESPVIRLSAMGVYNIVYFAVDWNNRTERNFSYAMEVVDDVPPVITLEAGYAQTAKVGKAVALAKATATDNVDENLTIGIFVVRPDGKRVSGVGGYYLPQKAGVYTVEYYVVDDSGNTAKVYYNILVEE